MVNISLASRVGVLSALCLLGVADNKVAAQESPATNAATEKPFCFRGRPLPKCRAFAITEFGGDFRLFSRKTQLSYVSLYDSTVIRYDYEPSVFSVTGEAGAMYNLNSKNAVGAVLLLRSSASGAQYGIKARYRRWLTPDGLAFDAALGIANGDDGSRLSGSPSTTVTGDVAINVQDFVALRMRVDLNRTQAGTKPAVYAGVRAGSFPALGAAALVGTGFAILLGIFVAAGGVD